MISDKMAGLVKNSSAIRAMFEEGKKLAEKYGAENVFDFSLGNPNIPAPDEVKKAIVEILEENESSMVHGYMNNSGYEEVRETIADNINKKHKTNFTYQNIIMTVGAAGGLNVIFKSLINPGDEIITFAPFFGEYRNYASNVEGELVVVPPSTVDFQPNLKEFKKKITEKTKIVLVNSPNNPTGVVYSEEIILKLSKILEGKQEEFGHPIYLISDEPYREIVYDGAIVPYLTKYYKNTIVGYSYSKSLSLPGERIGYLVIPDEVEDSKDILEAANVANRILGFVNAPSLMQKVVEKCVDAEVNVGYYNDNREKLYHSLMEFGFECVKPEGAFYLFMKSPIPNEVEFCEAAKKHHLLLVPGSSFGCPGYVRIAYCVKYDTIQKSLPAFAGLAEQYL